MSWTFPVPRLGLARTQVHWLVLLLIAFDVVGMSRGAWPWWLLPAVVPLFWLGHYAHEVGHALAARWTGMRIFGIEMQMLVGGKHDLHLALKPGKLMAFAAAGPLANLVCAGAAWGIEFALPTTSAMEVPRLLLDYLFYVNLRQAAFNTLLPIYPFDAGLFVRALLWPVIGLHRAVQTAIVLGYITCIVAVGLGVWAQNMMMVFLGIAILFNMAQEHRSIRNGYDPWLQADPRFAGSNRPFWHGWAARRQQQAAERVEREEAEEQEVLDRLLAKVSEHGLPSLTAAERSQLERISKHQRQRQHV